MTDSPCSHKKSNVKNKKKSPAIPKASLLKNPQPSLSTPYSMLKFFIHQEILNRTGALGLEPA